MLLLLVICQIMFVLSYREKTDYVAIEISHYYNNIVSVNDVATLKKKKSVIIEYDLESNGGSEFDDDDLQEVYQQKYSQYAKCRF